jgi:hypothetical protein
MFSYIYNLFMGTEEVIENNEEVIIEQSLTPNSMVLLPENKI